MLDCVVEVKQRGDALRERLPVGYSQPVCFLYFKAIISLINQLMNWFILKVNTSSSI